MSNTTIIPCPSCARKLRMPSNRVILATCPHCGRKFYVNNGRLDLVRNRVMEMDGTAGGTSRSTKPPVKKPLWKRPVAYLPLLLLLLVGGIFFKVHYLDEWNTFAAYEANPSLETAKVYLKDFRDRPRAAIVVNGRDSIKVAEARAAMDRTCEKGSCDCVPLKRLTPAGINFASSGVPMLDVWQDAVMTSYEECLFRRTATEPSISAVNFFNDNFPESIYSDSIRAIAGALWAGVIKDFEAGRSDKRRTAQQRFFRSVLDYVAASGNNYIYVSFRQEKRLKDWDEYSSEAREITDQITRFSNERGETAYPLPSEEPPSSIKAFFQANTSVLEGQLVETVQKKMDNLFGAGMIRVRRTEREAEKTGLAMRIDYLVRTLEDENLSGLSFPGLYVWSKTRENEFGLPASLDPEQVRELEKAMADVDPGLRKRILSQYKNLDGNESAEQVMSRMEFKGYLLASSIDWELTMTYPDNPKPYYYESFSRPVARISDVNTQTEAYRKMMSTAFDNFSLAFLREFGLE